MQGWRNGFTKKLAIAVGHPDVQSHHCLGWVSTIQQSSTNVQNFCKGSFTNYVDQFFTFLDHLPTCRRLLFCNHLFKLNIFHKILL
jgi:hypothetical protein